MLTFQQFLAIAHRAKNFPKYVAIARALYVRRPLPQALYTPLRRLGADPRLAIAAIWQVTGSTWQPPMLIPSARVKRAATQTGKPVSDVARAKISATLKGRQLTADHRAKLRLAARGKQLTADHLAKMRAGQIGKSIPDVTRAKISRTLQGHPVTDATRAKLSAATKAYNATKKSSP